MTWLDTASLWDGPTLVASGLWLLIGIAVGWHLRGRS